MRKTYPHTPTQAVRDDLITFQHRARAERVRVVVFGVWNINFLVVDLRKTFPGKAQKFGSLTRRSSKYNAIIPRAPATIIWAQRIANLYYSNLFNYTGFVCRFPLTDSIPFSPYFPLSLKRILLCLLFRPVIWVKTSIQVENNGENVLSKLFHCTWSPWYILLELRNRFPEPEMALTSSVCLSVFSGKQSMRVHFMEICHSFIFDYRMSQFSGIWDSGQTNELLSFYKDSNALTVQNEITRKTNYYSS